MTTSTTPSKDEKAETTTQNENDQPSSSFKIKPEHVHPDPVLSRLRLNDQFGKPILDPKTYFRDCKVVAFFFATNWRYDRECVQNDVMDLCRSNPHRFKCIYVSIDSNLKDFAMAIKEKPWINMIWHDGSNDDEGKPKQQVTEDFLTPEDGQLLKDILAGKVDLKQDPRPVSRVGLCHQLNVLYAPTLAVYHLESRTWLDMHVRESLLSSKEKRKVALETWEKGERLEMSWGDIFHGLRWAIMMIVLGVGYALLVQLDDSYNIVHFVEKFMNNGATTSTTNTGPSIAEYEEL